MLLNLSIRNVVLIEKLDLNFDSGFCVFTGETGAGKSILLDALCLVLGQRGEQNLIRSNADQASVFAEFIYNDDYNNFFDQNDLPVREIITLRRVLQAKGRSKAFINDEPVSVQILKALGDQLLNIHGQHDHLFEINKQRDLLDATIDKNIKQAVENAFNALQIAKNNITKFDAELAGSQSQRAFIKMQLDDLNKLRPLEQEESILKEKRNAIVGFAKIADTISTCLKGLTYPKDLAAEIAQHQQTLIRLNNLQIQELDEAAKCLDRAYIEVKESQQMLHDLLDQHQEQAYQLQIYDQRYDEIHIISKKYGISGDELYHLWQILQKQSNTLDDPEYQRSQLLKEFSKTKQEYIDAAKILSDKRKESAKILEKFVHNELSDLFLPHAKFRINLKELPESHWGTTGSEQVIFEVCMNPGNPFSALHKTASGGEMSRFMLALKVATSSQKNSSTQIFDEIDQGVSGAIALAIGKRLRRLGSCGQIMAITHSAQVASQAEHHFVVKKEQEETSSNTKILVLDKNEKITEIARMLSGHEINDASRQAAVELIKS